MGLADLLLGSLGGNATTELAQKFGISPDQAASAVSALAPALASGFQRNVSAEGGLESLLGALMGGGHQQYVDDPTTLGLPGTIDDGNAILGHVLGSKDVSRQVAAQASSQTGLGADLLKKMLPVIAAMAMGALSKNTAGLGGQERTMTAGAGGGLGDLLGSLLGGGGQKSGGAADAIGMLGKLLG